MQIWAITSYFNPYRYQTRIANFTTFQEHLNIPLVAVELSHDGEFELSDGAAEILLRVSCPNIMWQKERLLNLALGLLPAQCDTVAWLDCDVIFENVAWADAASRCLRHGALVQPFSVSRELAQDQSREDAALMEPTRQSFAFEYRQSNIWKSTSHAPWCDGYAWVARRDILDRHGFYDAAVIGGGTLALLRAAIGRFSPLISAWQMTPAHARHYLNWARPFCQTVQGQIGFVEGSLVHLWHGEMAQRQYGKRQNEFARYRFDPAVDLAINSDGVWRWSSPKTEMHEFVRQYFLTRNEDG